MDKIIKFSHEILNKKISCEDICVDMTVGKGNDTLFLCNIAKYVYGFDIQQIALDKTKELLKNHNKENYKLFLSSHDKIDELIHEKIKGIIYNLGYLPSGDKSITTKANSTISSLTKALKMIQINGVIVIVIYPGHEEGYQEMLQILQYVKQLDQHEFEVVKYEFINQINQPPFVIVIERIK